MKTSEKLRSHAQNEEMINQFFTEHGEDCNAAADDIEWLQTTLTECQDSFRSLLEIAEKDVNELNKLREELAAARKALTAIAAGEKHDR